MAYKLQDTAQEGSSYVVKVQFFERDVETLVLTPITPNPGLVWSLKSPGGSIVNYRDRVPLTPAPAVIIALSTNDLLLSASYPEWRIIEIVGTYDSVYGTGLGIRVQALLKIENLVG